ncbi:MAG: HAD family hydrolase [Terriglobales bacterium]
MDSSEQDPFPFCRANAIRALAFDCDGVLLDSGRSYYLAYERVLRESGAHVSPREIYLEEGQPTPEVLRLMLKKHGIPASSAMIHAMVERRREYQEMIGGRKFFPVAVSLLRKLRASHYKLAMVTGSSRKSVELVLTSEIRTLLDDVITADDVERPKPNPQPFELAAGAMGVPPTQCLAIENAPYGIQSAKSARCPTIAICTTLRAEDLRSADWIVPNHAALEKLLASGQTEDGATAALMAPDDVTPEKGPLPW